MSRSARHVTVRGSGSAAEWRRLRQWSPLAEQLGAAAALQGPVVADAIEADPTGQTSVPGPFPAGDLTGPMPSVASTMASGAAAAAAVVHSWPRARAHARTRPDRHVTRR
ncbi:MAG: hypothetical protein ACRD07_17445 [Acidimicrobiales bacterium]